MSFAILDLDPQYINHTLLPGVFGDDARLTKA
jgi:hypothetical protein